MKNIATYTTLYVSQKNGNDNDTGENYRRTGASDGPLKSIEMAWKRICEMRRFGAFQPMTIRLMDGVYATEKPLSLQPDAYVKEDFTAAVTVESFGGEKCLVSGGRKLTGWKRDTFNGVSCLSVCLDDVKNGKWTFTDLYVNGGRADLPRYPEKDLLLPESVENNVKMFNQPSRWFIAKEGDIRDFRNFGDCIISFCHWWIDEHVKIASYDKATRKVTFAAKTRFSISDFQPHSGLRYYIENVAEMFCKPGHWYLDRPTGMLYYIPRDGETAETLDVWAPVVERLIEVSGAKAGAEHKHITGVRFRNLKFAYTKGDYVSQGFAPNCETATADDPFAADPQACSSMHGMLNFDHAHNCAVENCELFCFGTHGIVLERGTTHTEIKANRFRNGGGGAVRINGEGIPNLPASREYTTDNRVTDNEMCFLGRRHFAACGILAMFAANNEISHNSIHDLYYSGISCGWNWGYEKTVSHHNRIEKNLIYNIGFGMLSDMGGVYVLGGQPGTVIAGNVIHDVISSYYGGWALYTDEGSSQMTIENNICWNVSENCFHQHFGGQNVVRNNVFAFSRDGSVRLSKKEQHVGVLMDGNLHYLAGMPKYGRNDEFGLCHGNLSTAREIAWDAANPSPVGFRIGDPKHPEQDTVYSLSELKTVFGIEEDTLIADPQFVNPEAYDFSLKPTSPAFEMGFTAIDTSDVGPRVKF